MNELLCSGSQWSDNMPWWFWLTAFTIQNSVITARYFLLNSDLSYGFVMGVYNLFYMGFALFQQPQSCIYVYDCFIFFMVHVVSSECSARIWFAECTLSSWFSHWNIKTVFEILGNFSLKILEIFLNFVWFVWPPSRELFFFFYHSHLVTWSYNSNIRNNNQNKGFFICSWSLHALFFLFEDSFVLSL